MTTRIIIELRGGVISGVLADGPLEATVVDHDDIAENGDRPTLPSGVEYDADGDLKVVRKPWDDVVLG